MKEQRKTNYSYLYYQRNKDKPKYLFLNYRRNKDKAKCLFLIYRRNEDKPKYLFLNYRRNETKRSIRSSTIDDLTLLVGNLSIVKFWVSCLCQFCTCLLTLIFSCEQEYSFWRQPYWEDLSYIISNGVWLLLSKRSKTRRDEGQNRHLFHLCWPQMLVWSFIKTSQGKVLFPTLPSPAEVQSCCKKEYIF